jgi:hypothetical protein
VIAADTPCDLCSLPVGLKPFVLVFEGRSLKFCCEGCLGIYQMLHDINEIPAATGQNTQDHS